MDMTKGKKALKGIGITLLVLLILAAIIFGIIIAILNGGYNPDGAAIEYSYLRIVMQDDVVYLADEFMSENNLSFKVLPPENPYHNIDNAVYLNINRRKVHDYDFTKRVENLDGYSYSLVNNSEDSMPIAVSVRGIAGKDDNIKTKCNKKTVDGYKYGMSYGGELIRNSSVIYKEVVVRTNGSKSLISKKNCILEVSVSIRLEDAQYYNDEEIIARFDEVLNSALAHIERYGE